MCGRFTLATPAEVVAEFFALPDTPELAPRHNIAPTQPVATIVHGPDGAARELRHFQWGLVPSWAKDPGIGSRMINARAETVAEKPAFRAAFRRRRCLVVADGFYEWKKLSKGKQPYYIRKADDSPFAIAGLWEHWSGADGTAIDSCTLITGAPNSLVRDLHDRMPVILDKPDFDAWLDVRNEDAKRLQPLLKPFPAERMKAVPVSTRVNNPTRDDPECIRPADDPG